MMIAKKQLLDSMKLEEFVPNTLGEWTEFKDDLRWFLAVKRHIKVDCGWKKKLKRDLKTREQKGALSQIRLIF